MQNLIQDKLSLAQKSYQEWRFITFEKKQNLFKKLSDILLENKEIYAEIITSEMNKPISQSIAEVEKCAMMVNFYAKAENILAPEKIKTNFNISEIHHTPMGVILGVMPWNYPFWQVLRFATPTILAGNTVVMKHASICFGTGRAIEEAFTKAGFPKGIFQNFELGHSEIKEIIEHPIVKGVSLTGSEEAGAMVASIAGKSIKKSVLELGGSDAYIVLEDADLQKAAKIGAFARLQNCGQTCVAAKRFIIHKNIKDSFLNLFIDEYRKYQPENPWNKSTTLSGMARKDLADELENQYQKTIDGGAEILIPLERVSDNEFIPGLVLVEKDHPILSEEIFGPLGLVLIAESDDDALSLANDIPYGLGNAVWTKNSEKAMYFAERLDSGTVAINSMTKSDPNLPFGGAKRSGYGTELSLQALKEFTIPKTIVKE
ncbi:aldehyde dehydrogenase family protein [Riemerella columbipharyngis]|uniref:Succinate-semialdehyde dehydrogenase / glutarate-semialdehyde dehydrogenase n=1 Tax=Riemerella columbipharyngis TaxID=1071918 RepID=A0A1G6YQM4_9FLAO|nr:aldehyde dehydrogenase family protein [Riemerella columbipharyngis]SDD92709.1 succinate-semialdehyde dehydrogenase / glutarate-semialdehyde dehydrogenase [Riemerella columbipharyngis]